MTGGSSLVSIIMAVYNGELYLKECIDSIIGQSYDNWELIVINDGSKDGTSKILETYKKGDDRIRVFNLDKNSGLVYCLNFAIRESKGLYLARMDADDVMYPERLSLQTQFMDDNLEVGVLGSNVDLIDLSGTRFGQWTFPNSDKGLKDLLINKCPFMHPSVMIRKDTLMNIPGPYSEEYPACEDYDLWIKLHKVTKFASSSIPVIKYRVHPNQITQGNIKKVSGDNFRLTISSILAGRISFKAILYIWKPVFYIISPHWLIKYKIKLRDKVN